MRARSWERAVACALVALLGVPYVARADGASDGRAANASSITNASGASGARGIAVLARAGAENAAWALAKELYARPSLRPVSLDEEHARVLVGDPAPADAPRGVKDLVDERAGVHGDDGASRALLHTIASQLGVGAIIVVEPGAGGSAEPSARVFLVDGDTFDAARYESDPSPPEPSVDAGASAAASATSDAGMATIAPLAPATPTSTGTRTLHWSGAVASLERAYGVGEPEAHAPPLATSAIPQATKGSESHPFYTSPWFWGAVGAAAFGGVAVYFATRDNTTGTIHLELQVPK